MLTAITGLFLVWESCLCPHNGLSFYFITSSISTLRTYQQRVHRKLSDVWTKRSIFTFLPRHGSQALTQKWCCPSLYLVTQPLTTQNVQGTSHSCWSKQTTSLCSHSSFGSTSSAKTQPPKISHLAQEKEINDNLNGDTDSIFIKISDDTKSIKESLNTVKESGSKSILRGWNKELNLTRWNLLVGNVKSTLGLRKTKSTAVKFQNLEDGPNRATHWLQAQYESKV